MERNARMQGCSPLANLNQESDELFESLLASKNINFTRSQTAIFDDFPFLQELSSDKENESLSTNSQNVCQRKLLSSKSTSKEISHRKWSFCNSDRSKLNRSFSINTPSKLSRRTIDLYKWKTVKNCRKTSLPVQRKAECSGLRPFLNNDELSNNLDGPSLLSTPKRFSLISNKETPFKDKDCILIPQTSELKEKQKEAVDSKSFLPLHNITFRNKSSQKKDRPHLSETESDSLSNKFFLVSACNSSPMYVNSSTTESPVRFDGLLKTPVGRCSQPLLQTPISHLTKSILPQTIKTPKLLSLPNKPESPKPLTGIKKLQASMRKRFPVQPKEKENIYKKNLVIKEINLSEDDDLPCTQPISEIILKGVVAYVEIRSDREYRNEGVKAELESLGAKVEKNFTKKVTHCFFKDGRMSTYKRAVDWKVPLVCVLWIEACKAELRQVPLKDFKPHGLDKYEDAIPLYRTKTRIRRPVTDSKVMAKLRKQAPESSKTTKETPVPPPPRLGPQSQTGQLIDALYSVAGDFKKATHQFEKILTSPILQKRHTKENSNSSDILENESSEEIFEKKKKRNKKLVFASSSDEDCNKANKLKDKSSAIDESANEVRISYDSDDLLVYAKKQAANSRCSAPARLLTSRKCKKLLSSCRKAVDIAISGKNETSLKPVVSTNAIENTRRSSKRISNKNKKKSMGIKSIEKEKPKLKKRKLLEPLQVIATFEQDSSESISEASDVPCPYKVSPNKRQKAAAGKFVKPQAPAPVLSDWESDDSQTRAARRESSALFVKKDKKAQACRFVPTIVCTSLHKSDVEVVASIAARLGKFAMESAVSERTTHVVTASCRRTINLLKGIARGCWVLDVQWVYESLEAGKWLHEERFELTSFSPAVRQSRLERQAFGPEFSLELFNHVGPMYICRGTAPPPQDLTELLGLCGGQVVGSARAARLVIGSARPFSPTFNTRPPLLVRERWVLDSVTRMTPLDPGDYVVDEPEA